MRRVIPITIILLSITFCSVCAKTKSQPKLKTDRTDKLIIEQNSNRSLSFITNNKTKSDYYILYLTDYRGEIILERRIKSSAIGKRLNIEMIPAGVYSINIDGNRDSFHGLFIK